jgi:hypothetical protein
MQLSPARTLHGCHPNGGNKLAKRLALPPLLGGPKKLLASFATLIELRFAASLSLRRLCLA